MPEIQVIAGGRGDENDVALVAAELLSLPAWVVDSLDENGVTIIACKNDVTDYAADLAHKRPREWDKDSTWVGVPGAYIPRNKAVVVATVEFEGSWIVPPFGMKHGSANLAVHEALHGYDYTADPKPSRATRFRDAWAADYDRLAVDYFRSPVSGAEESYAESGARTLGSWAGRRDDWPTLRDYWGAATEPDREFDPAATAPGAAEPLGFGRVTRDGRVQLFLTARGENGEHGHGMIELTRRELTGAPFWNRIRPERDEYELFDVPSLEGLDR